MSSLIFLLNQAEKAREGEAHASTIIGKVNQCTTHLVGASMYMLIHQLTRVEKVWKKALDENDVMKREAEDLKRFVEKDSDEVRRPIQQFAEAFESARLGLRRPLDLPIGLQQGLAVTGFQPIEDDDESGGHSKMKEAFNRMAAQKELNDKVTDAAETIFAMQLPLSRSRNDSYNEIREKMDVLLKVAVAVSLTISLGLALSFSLGVRKRIAALVKNTVLFASGRPLEVTVSGDDEIALLDKSFRKSAQQLEEIRRRERAVLENAANVICSCTPDGRILTINSAVERLWGYAPEEFVGARLAKFLVAEDAQALSKAFAEISQTGAGSFENRVRVRRDNGLSQVLDIHWNVRAVPAERALTCVAHDITEQKRLERMKREFSELVRNGLQSPLETVSATLAEISAHRTEVTEKFATKAETTNSELSRLFKLLDEFIKLDDLSDFGKSENYKSVSASEVIQQSIQSLKDWAARRKVELVGTESTAVFVGDLDKIVRVVVNLLSNAVKFSPQNARVVLAAADLNDFVEFQIIDQGPGIEEKDQAAIFEKFRMLEQSQDTARESSGLGLAICQSIVSRHGGTIGVRSDGKTGSTFWFRLPKAEIEVSDS
jgi:PAS domain S-box-containing protein